MEGSGGLDSTDAIENRDEDLVRAAAPFPYELRTRDVQLNRRKELKLQEEFIARNGIKKLPPVSSEAESARCERIRDFKRELQEKYQRQER